MNEHESRFRSLAVIAVCVTVCIGLMASCEEHTQSELTTRQQCLGSTTNRVLEGGVSGLHFQ